MFLDNLAEKNKLILCGIAAPILFIMNIVIWGGLTPEYDHLRQYVSELGAMEAPFALLMNWLGIIPFGGLICIFSLGYFVTSADNVSRWLTAPCLFLTGVGFTLAGIYACDAGCSFIDMSISGIIHNLSAFSAFALAILTVCLALISQIKKKNNRRLLSLNLLFLVAMIVSFTGLIYLGPDYEYVGVVQRGFLLPFCLWLFFIGTELLE